MVSSGDRIEKQLRQRICSICYAELRESSCGPSQGLNCPLFQHLDEVIAAIAETDGDSADLYDAIRKGVCSGCRMRDDGLCDRREVLDCALDMYLPLIAEIVQTSLGRKRCRAG
jgi:hypothetical protein